MRNRCRTGGRLTQPTTGQSYTIRARSAAAIVGANRKASRRTSSMAARSNAAAAKGRRLSPRPKRHRCIDETRRYAVTFITGLPVEEISNRGRLRVYFWALANWISKSTPKKWSSIFAPYDGLRRPSLPSPDRPARKFSASWHSSQNHLPILFRSLQVVRRPAMPRRHLSDGSRPGCAAPLLQR